jgi:hypothetical protein
MFHGGILWLLSADGASQVDVHAGRAPIDPTIQAYSTNVQYTTNPMFPRTDMGRLSCACILSKGIWDARATKEGRSV